MHVDWDPLYLSLLEFCISLQMEIPPCKNHLYRSINKNCIRLVLVVKRSFGMWHMNIFYNQLNISSSLPRDLTYTNNTVDNNRSFIHFDLNTMLGPSKSNLQSTADHHGHSIDFGHYNPFINCYSLILYCIYDICTNRSCSIFDQTVEGGRWSTPLVSGQLSFNWIQVEDPTSKPVGWKICFSQMTSALVQILTRIISLYMYLNIWLNRVGMVYGGLPVPRTGCPVPDVGFHYIIDIHQKIEMIDTL